MTKSHSYRQILLDFKELAKKTASVLLEKQKVLHTLNFSYKNHEQYKGVVSDADYEAEKIILDSLSEKYPHIPQLSEEKSHKENIKDFQAFQEQPHCFVIDPLDGSKNFLHGLDYYCIALALLEFGQPKVGLVLRPPTGELFSAIMGEGAWLQGPSGNENKKLFVNPKEDKPVESCLFSMSAKQSKKSYNDYMKRMENTRQFGSAALELCQVAAGRLDGYCARNLSPWDAAAAMVILKEANIVTSNFAGEEMDCFGQTFLAAPKGLHQKLQKFL